MRVIGRLRHLEGIRWFMALGALRNQVPGQQEESAGDQEGFIRGGRNHAAYDFLLHER